MFTFLHRFYGKWQNTFFLCRMSRVNNPWHCQLKMNQIGGARKYLTLLETLVAVSELAVLGFRDQWTDSEMSQVICSPSLRSDVPKVCCNVLGHIGTFTRVLWNILDGLSFWLSFAPPNGFCKTLWALGATILDHRWYYESWGPSSWNIFYGI